MTRKIEFGLYEKRSGEGPAFICRPLVDSHERLLFTGATAEIVEADARRWIEKNFGKREAPKPREPREPAGNSVFD
ncbi:hypothetical protein [EBPR siphovirus 2]|nr:hypothetical protein [EBPR siphovirus 2]